MHCTRSKIAIVAVTVSLFVTGLTLNILFMSTMLPLGNKLRGYLSLIGDAPQDLRQLPNVSYLLIVIGIVVKPSAILGCRGAFMLNRCRLLTSSSFILVIFIAQLCAAIILLAYETNVSEYFQQTAVYTTASIGKDYGMGDSVTTFWTSTMAELECCGYNDYTDFTGSPYFINSSLYPRECCKDNTADNTADCTAALAHTDNVQGCVVPLVNNTKKTAYTVGTVALVTCFVEITAMIFSMVYYKKVIKKEEVPRPASISLSESPNFVLPASAL